MENNSDRMGFALIALSVVAFVLLAVNGTLQPTVKGFFNGFNNWEMQTFAGINESNKQDVTHTAYSWSSDGNDRFTTIKPNLNLLTRTAKYEFPLYNNGGTQTVQKYDDETNYIQHTSNTPIGNMGPWFAFTPEVGQVYTFSADVSGNGSIHGGSFRYEGGDNGNLGRIDLTNDWQRISNTIRVNKIDGWVNWPIYAQNSTLLKVKHIKIEKGSVATPYMPSASEVKSSDQPKYIGTYTDKSESASQDPTKYTWKSNPEYHE